MRKFSLLIFLFISFLCPGQGNTISITSTVPSQITVCGTPQTFTISIYNPSPFPVTNDTLKLSMPTGMVYQIGSVTGTGVSEFNTTIANKPVFLLPSITSLAPALNISFTAAANCDIINYISGGGTVENNIRVNYTANGTNSFDVATTLTYTVKQPALSITSVTNQSYSGSIGNTFTRCITVTNSGLGALDHFSFSDVHGAGVTVSNVTGGSWSNAGLTENISFTSTNFTSVGNNNGLLEQGESVTLCETVHINSCVGVASNYSAAWGCNSQTCQIATGGANVVFPNLIPNVEITSVGPPMNPCPGSGNSSLQKLMITNSGTGQATNIHLDIFQTNNGSGYNTNMGSYIDVSSLSIQHGSSTPTTLVPDSTKTTSALNCMPSNPVGRIYVTIPSLNPGETIYLSWNTYSCCYNNCTSTGQSYFNGWAYQGDYSNACQNSYIISTAWGRVHSQLFASLTNYASISVLDSGEVGTFSFDFSSFVQQQPYPGDTSGYWKFVFTVPSCLISASSPSIISSDGSSTWSPSSINTSGNDIIARFNEEVPPFDLNSARVSIDLEADCNGCSGGLGSVDLKAIYVASASCSCEVTLSCSSAPITVLCAPTIVVTPEPSDSDCPQGMMFRYCSFGRTSYGLPDNETGGGNGVPDNGGSLDFSKIKLSRAMFGDTIANVFFGKIRTNLSYPSFHYCYASSQITNANLLTYLDGKLQIYRNGNLMVTCNNFSPTITVSGTTKTYSYDLSTAGLISNGCMPAGFTYSNSDSVVFTQRYKVTTNTMGPIFSCLSTNDFYVSAIANPTLPTDKFQCDGYAGICYIMGYKFESKDNSYYTIKSCENAVISQQYFLTIGPCCSNYDGGNLFPYEYRNWAHIDTLKAQIPSGYTFVSAQFTEHRTAGSGVNASSGPINIVPINTDSSTLVFPVEHFFDAYGGPIPLSDDGFSGTLEVTLSPSCSVTPVISQGIKYDWEFGTTNYTSGVGSFPTSVVITSDYIIYNAPSTFLQSILPTVNTPDSLAIWDITISNSSNTSNAENTWLGAPVISGVSAVELIDLDSNLIIVPNGDIYHLGITFAATTRHFRIKATYTSCNQDSIIIYAGWNCVDGYPADVNSYPCTPQKITLIENPLIPALDITVAGPTGSIQLCDTTTYTVNGFNFQAGTLYNVMLTTILPPGTNIVSGSAYLLYPSDSVFFSIPDPVLTNGTAWQWDLSAINSQLGNNGLKGFMDSTLNTVKIKFKLVTDCNFIAGSNIHFKLSGNAACGLPSNQEVTSDPIIIAGATPIYNTSVNLQSTYISPCASNSTMHVNIINNGPLAFGTTDSVVITFPEGVYYENASFTGQHNPPTNSNPTLYALNGQQIAKWILPSGIQAGDSVVFNFDYKGVPDETTCGISSFYASTQNVANVLCTSSGNACNIGVITGNDTLPMYTYKAYLSFSNPHGFTSPAPPLGETANINFTINNTGQDIFQAFNTIISYYYDADGSGTLSTTDTLIALDSLNTLIPGNDSVEYTASVFFPAGYACSIIAVIDTSLNFCACSGSQIVIPLQQIHVSSDTAICSGDSITIGFPPINGYSYLWTPAAGLSNLTSSSPNYTAPSLSGSANTVYLPVTTSRINCISIDTVQVVINPNPQLVVSGTDTICFGDSSGTAIAIINGIAPAASYTWNTAPAQLNDTATGLTHGTYSVVVRDTNGCQATQQFTIHQTTSPVTVSVSNQTNLLCSSNCDGSASANASGGAMGYTYSWSTNPLQTSSTALNLCAGTYTVLVTDAVGCSADTNILISSPPPLLTSITLTDATCNSDNSASASVTVGGGYPTYTYLWNNGQADSVIIDLSPGIYVVVVRDSSNCTISDTAIITPAVSVSLGAVSTSVCEGQSTSLSSLISSGTPSYTFSWNTGATTDSITVTPLSQTEYFLIVTDINGCIDSSSITIGVRAGPQVVFNADSVGCSPFCVNFQNTSTIDSGQITNWLWSFGDGSTSNLRDPQHCFVNPDPNSPVTSSISLTATSDEGCSSTMIKNNFISINPSPIAAFDYSPKPPTVLNPVVSFINQSIGSTSWLWLFTNGINDTNSIFQNPYYTYIDTGSFAATLIAKNNYSCADTVTETIIIGQDWALYIPGAFTPDEDDINDVFYAKGYGIIEFEMLIFDRWGNLIFKSDNINNGWDGRANGGKNSAQRDVYVYSIKAKDVLGGVHKYRGTVTLVK